MPTAQTTCRLLVEGPVKGSLKQTEQAGNWSYSKHQDLHLH